MEGRSSSLLVYAEDTGHIASGQDNSRSYFAYGQENMVFILRKFILRTIAFPLLFTDVITAYSVAGGIPYISFRILHDAVDAVI